MAVIDATESPYKTAKGVRKEQRTVSLVSLRLNDKSLLMIRETLYVLLVLSKEREGTKGT
jgi:hypothetical protein